MFVRTFFAVLGMPLANFFDNNWTRMFSMGSPSKETSTVMEINTLKLVKRSHSKKKLSFEITKADLEQDMIEFKGSPDLKHQECR